MELAYQILPPSSGWVPLNISRCINLLDITFSIHKDKLPHSLNFNCVYLDTKLQFFLQNHQFKMCVYAKIFAMRILMVLSNILVINMDSTKIRDYLGFTWRSASTPSLCQQSLWSISLADATATAMLPHSTAKLNRVCSSFTKCKATSGNPFCCKYAIIDCPQSCKLCIICMTCNRHKNLLEILEQAIRVPHLTI